MKISTERLEKSQMALEVEVEPEQLERSMDRAYRRLVAKTNIPGFRRGKAPRHMVERYLGRAALLEEALDILVPEAYNQAIDEQDIEAIGQPNIEILKIEPTVSFKATVPIRPTVELGDYRELTVPHEPQQITDEQVAQTLEEMRSRYAPWEPVDRPVEFDDLVTLDIDSTIEGERYFQQTAASFPVRKDWPVPVPGFPEQLVGMTKGEAREFTLTMPDDYPDQRRAGKPAEFTVSVSEIKAKQLPELNDEFAKTVGEGFDSLDALRDQVRKDLQENLDRESRARLESEVIDAVVAQAQIEYPEILVEHEVQHLMEDDRSIPKDSKGRIEESFFRAIGQTPEEFRERYREEAVKRVERTLVLSNVTEAEHIEATPEEVDAEIDRLVQDMGEQAEAMRNFFTSEESRASIQRVLVRRKTMDRLIEAVAKKREGEAEEAGAAEAEPETPASPPAGRGRGRRKSEAEEPAT